MLDKFYPGQTFAALLFDFDGTIADTMLAHFDSWNNALAKYNLTLSREQHLAMAGRPTRQIVQMLSDLHQVDISFDELSKAKEQLYMSSLSQIKEIAPVVAFIRHYKGKLPMAVVSGSRRKHVEVTLKHLNLSDYFAAIVCAEDYVNGKPAPDCFLKAANLLNVDPLKCLVFEDAELGIQSALNAGMPCLRVSENHEITKV